MQRTGSTRRQAKFLHFFRSLMLFINELFFPKPIITKKILFFSLVISQKAKQTIYQLFSIIHRLVFVIIYSITVVAANART